MKYKIQVFGESKTPYRVVYWQEATWYRKGKWKPFIAYQDLFDKIEYSFPTVEKAQEYLDRHKQRDKDALVGWRDY